MKWVVKADAPNEPWKGGKGRLLTDEVPGCRHKMYDLESKNTGAASVGRIRFLYRQNFFPPNDDSVRKPIELFPVSPDGVIKPKNAKDDDTPLNGETTKKGLEKRYKMLKGGFRFPESSHDFKFFNQVGFMIRWTICVAGSHPR